MAVDEAPRPLTKVTPFDGRNWEQAAADLT